MALTGRLDGQPLDKEITANLFSNLIRKQYITKITLGEKPKLPKIIIEIYFKDEDEYAAYKGEENSLNLDRPGIHFELAFDSKFEADYKDRISIDLSNADTNDFFIRDIPTEYYSVRRTYFNGCDVIQRKNPFRVFFVDGTRKSYANYVGKYIYSNLGDVLTNTQLSQIRTVYAGIRQKLKNHDVLQQFNEKNQDILTLAGKEIALTVRESLPDEWLQEITVSVDEFPFDNIGFGLQKMIEMELAVDKTQDKEGILLFEEPENNLSYSSMSKLIDLIEKSDGKQKFISTHSSFVANKLGLNDLLLCQSGEIEDFKKIESSDYAYFKKLPGYNTLRLLLSKHIVLVEGPTDELIFNKAYLDKNGKLPIADEIDVFVVDSLAFKRYLDLSIQINKEVIAITDNDGDEKAFNKKYEKYLGNDLITFFYEKDFNLHTIEPSIIAANKEENQLNVFKQIVDKNNRIKNRSDGSIDEDKLLKYMTNNKAEWALRVFDSKQPVIYPANINEAINYVNR